LRSCSQFFFHFWTSLEAFGWQVIAKYGDVMQAVTSWLQMLNTNFLYVMMQALLL
jgi:hypothetical protein